MAKKRTEKKTKTFSEAIGLQYIFNNTITDFFIGLALVVIAVVIIIAMISFLNTGANDQSLLENLKPGDGPIRKNSFKTTADPGEPSSPIGSSLSISDFQPSCSRSLSLWWDYR